MEFADLGAHCAYDLCGQQTFTPFECDQCNKMFCRFHRTQTTHECIKLEKKKELPKEETKEEKESTTADNESKEVKKDKKNRLKPHKCRMKGCKKRSWMLIQCPDGCGKSYCLEHRNPLDHKCPPKDSALREQRNAFLERMLQATAMQKIPDKDPLQSCGAQESKARQWERKRHHQLHRYTAF